MAPSPADERDPPDREPAEDPFAFPPDVRDAARDGSSPSAPGDAAGSPRSGPADAGRLRADAGAPGPGAGAPDAAPTPAGTRPAETPPVASGAGPGDVRVRSGDPGAADRDRRRRDTAEQAAAHARAVGLRWLTGALVVVAVVVGIGTLRSDPDGAGDVRPGTRLPDFAAPLALRPKLDGDDVNLAQEDGQGEAGERAACSIRNPSVVTSCGLLARGPLVIVVFTGGVQECVATVDELDRLQARNPRIRTLAVQTLGDHAGTSEVVRRRRWTLPVVYDRDQALSTVLGPPVCPVVLLVRPDGTVRERLVGRLAPGELRAAIARLKSPPPGGTTSVGPTRPGR